MKEEDLYWFIDLNFFKTLFYSKKINYSDSNLVSLFKIKISLIQTKELDNLSIELKLHSEINLFINKTIQKKY